MYMYMYYTMFMVQLVKKLHVQWVHVVSIVQHQLVYINQLLAKRPTHTELLHTTALESKHDD